MCSLKIPAREGAFNVGLNASLHGRQAAIAVDRRLISIFDVSRHPVRPILKDVESSRFPRGLLRLGLCAPSPL